MVRRILIFFFSFLGSVFLLGAYLIQSFSSKKLGMLRWVNFQSSKAEAFLPLPFLRVLCVILIVCTIFLLFRTLWRKSKSHRKAAFPIKKSLYVWRFALCGAASLSGAICLLLLLFFNRTALPAYYFLLLCLLVSYTFFVFAAGLSLQGAE